MIRAYDDNGNVVDLVTWEKQIRTEAIDEVIKGLMALKERNYATYYIDDELKFLEQLKENEE